MAERSGARYGNGRNAKGEPPSMSGRTTATSATVYVIEPGVCMGCAACVDVCPTRAVVPRDGLFAIERSLCDGCGLCARYCPLRAITPVQR